MQIPIHKTSKTGLCRIHISALILALLPILLWSCEKPADTAPSLSSLSRELNIQFEGASDFIIRTNFSKDRGQKNYRTIDARDGTRVIKIEVIKDIDDDAARSYISERKYVLHSQFQSAPSPYPGVISSEVAVPKEHAPKVITIYIDGAPHDLYLLPGTERFTYGAKDVESIRYKGGVLFAHDKPGGRVLRMDLFVPLEDYDEEEVLRLFSSLRITSKGVSAGSIEREQTENKSVATHENDQSPPSPPPGSPNLIIIGFEPLGARHVATYGYPLNTTPNLDNFARGSIIFEKAVSSSSWTLPAFMSWFTSLSPTRHTLTNKYRLATLKKDGDPELSRLPEGIVTLAQYLRKKGYATAGFTGGAAMSNEFGYGRGFDEYVDDATFGGFDITMPLAAQWLRENTHNPFFLFVQGFDVHGRFPVKKGVEKEFYNGHYDGPYTGTLEEYWELRDANLDDPEFVLPERDIRFWEANYDAKILEADRRFGTFIQEITELGILEDTVVIISSGSGNEYFEHGGLDHGLTLYDELVLVPLLLRAPGTEPRSVTQQVRTIDIMPTALDLLGIAPNEQLSAQMEGVSLTPLIAGRDLKLDAFMETDYLAQSFKRGVRTSDGYKFIYSMESGAREMYDLNSDPMEQVNIVDKDRTMSYKLERILFNHLDKLKTAAY